MKLITGGARSGKSLYAEKLAIKIGKGRAAYIATAQALDDEMSKRIELHKARRGANWQTFEAPFNADEKILLAGEQFSAILFDCVTVYISNLICAGCDEEKILTAADKLISAATKTTATTIFVTNEVGSGLVPDNELGRRFRDIAGTVNQRLAAAADEVILMVAGIPMVIKK